MSNRLLYRVKRFITGLSAAVIISSALISPYTNVAFAETAADAKNNSQTNATGAQDTSPNESADGAVTTGTGTVTSDTLWPAAPEISSGNVILMDADTGAILYEKDAYSQAYPASTTKILTALLAIENCNLTDIMTFSRQAAESVKYDEARLGSLRGEQFTVEQLLYGILLHSANEMAYGMAEYVSGSLSDFTDLMNKRAAELGAVNSHFVNASGLHDENHYTTAYDLAMIARACFNNSTFMTISGTTSYTIPPTNKYSSNRYLINRNAMLQGKSNEYKYCVAGKTGSTNAAGATLVTFAEKNGVRLICVTLNSSSPARYNDSTALFDWGFDNFSRLTASTGSISSLFSDKNYYNSDVFNPNTCVFELSNSTMSLPKNVSPGQVTIAVDDSGTVATGNSVYTTNIRYMYNKHTVGTAKLTIAGIDSYISSGKLPYAGSDEASTPTPKKRISISVWWLIGAGVLLMVIIYVTEYIRRLKRQRRRRKRRNHASRRYM